MVTLVMFSHPETELLLSSSTVSGSVSEVIASEPNTLTPITSTV